MVFTCRYMHVQVHVHVHVSRLEVPEQALGGIPLGLGMALKINLLNL